MIKTDWEADGIKIDSLRMEYPILTFEDSISNKVLDIYDFEKNKLNSGGNIMITLNGRRKVYIRNTENRMYEPYSLHEFLKVNDSIAKESNTDTFYVYREREKFLFVLEKTINRPSRNRRD